MIFLRNKIKNTFNNFKDFLPIIINLYLIILGISWVSFHIYLRFFMKRISYNLVELKLYITMKYYFLFLYFVILHCCFLIIAIVTLLKRYQILQVKGSLFISFGNTLNKVIDILYWQPLEKVHDIIAPHIPGSGRFFLYL